MDSIRLLKASEIECRVQSVRKSGNTAGCILLLYKDARCDMRILDEVFGPLGWEREHHVINGNLFCTIRVYDTEKKMWVSKQDVGTESNTEKEKGQASDSFKRACVNLGIGRELYTAPFIWINLNAGEYSERNNKLSVNSNARFRVKEIGYNESSEINSLVIVDTKNIVRYKLGEKIAEPTDIPVDLQVSGKSTTHSNNHTDSNGLKCVSCGKSVTSKISSFSLSKYHKVLCMDCQKEVK